jgi:uncharacterized protein YjlB
MSQFETVEVFAMTTEPLTFMFADDGSVPNNPTLPLLLYRGAVNVAATRDPESTIEQIFIENGWGHSMWRNGIYAYTHFHSMTHEVLGIARGTARVRFGGEQGQDIHVTAGDVVVLPAGTGHQRLSDSEGLSVIGGYPDGGRYDLCRGGGSEHAQALQTIPQVPLPECDPLYGVDGPLLALWQDKAPQRVTRR